MATNENTHDLSGQDLEADLRELMPPLFSEDSAPEFTDKPDFRIRVVDTLAEKYGKDALPGIYAISNRLLERGNAEGRFRFRLFPEPLVYPDQRVAKITPYVERAAAKIDEARDQILQTVLDLTGQELPADYDYAPLLFLSLTLDDGFTGGPVLRRLIDRPNPIRLHGRPFLVRHEGHTVAEECIPIAYCSARVLAAALRADFEITVPRSRLSSFYRRACTLIRRHHPGVEMPRNVTEYLSALRHHNTVVGIPALTFSRDRNEANAALPANATARLLTGRPIAPRKDARSSLMQGEERTIRAPELSRWITGESVEVVTPRIAQILQEWFEGSDAGDRDAIEALLGAEEADLSHDSLGVLLNGWVRSMVVNDRRLSRKSVRDRFNTVSSLLAPYAHEVAHYIDDAESWGWWYGRVLSDQNVRSNDAAFHHLQEFHRYLVSGEGATEVDWQFGVIDEAQKRVDNNLLTPADYDRALSWLEPSKGVRIVGVLRILLILGFRFGLRFSEARQIEIQQIEDAADPWIHVTPNRWLRRLKSDSRRLPADPMIPRHEWEELIAWRRLRLKEANGDGSAALLSAAADRPEPISESRVRPLLGETLLAATGDPAVRFHHLRHSCATWLFVRLMRPIVDQRVFDGVTALDHSDLHMERCMEWREKLLPQSPGQEAMWLVSQVLGHVSPAVTRRSYLRLIDWLGLAESWTFRRAAAPTLGALLKLGRSTAYELYARWGKSYGRRATQDWPSSAHHHVRLRQHDPEGITIARYAGPGAYVDMIRRCECANAIASAGQPTTHEMERLAAQWDLPAETAWRHLEALQHVQDRYKTKWGKPRFFKRVRIPRNLAEERDLAAWVSHVAAILDQPRLGDRVRVGRIVVVSAHSLSKHRSSLRFTSLRNAYRYIQDVQTVLGIDNCRWLALIRPITGESETALLERRRRIGDAIGLPTQRVRKRIGAKVAPRDPGTVELSVQAPKDGASTGPHQARRGSEAFRALVHYSLVWMHEQAVTTPFPGFTDEDPQES